MGNNPICKDSINILALDVATKTGFCTAKSSGVWNLLAKRDSSAGMRLIQFKANLKVIVESENIQMIVFERSQGRHQNAVIVQSELHGCLKLFCEENGIEYRAFSPNEIKKFATGKGNANKDLMVSSAKEKYGIKIIDDNHADAMHMYHLAMSVYG